MKAAALRGALSDRARAGRVHVSSSLVEGDAPSTKARVAALARVATGKHVLVVLERDDELSLEEPAQRRRGARARGRPAQHLRRARLRRRRLHRRRARRVPRRAGEGAAGQGGRAEQPRSTRRPRK